MPSMLTPNQEKLVTILPKTAKLTKPLSRTRPPQRAWRIKAFQRTIRSAPFSFGSQPQNRPQDWSAQIPPRTVPVKLNSVAKQTIAYTILARALPVSRPGAGDFAPLVLADWAGASLWRSSGVNRPRQM